MLEYSELPPVSSLFHECFLISADSSTQEQPAPATGKTPVPAASDKDMQKTKTEDGELSPKEREDTAPGRERPKRGPARFHNPDPILPGLQIKLSQDFQVKVIIRDGRRIQWMGPTA